jgi:hypothetical protein
MTGIAARIASTSASRTVDTVVFVVDELLALT